MGRQKGLWEWSKLSSGDTSGVRVASPIELASILSRPFQQTIRGRGWGRMVAAPLAHHLKSGRMALAYLLSECGLTRGPFSLSIGSKTHGSDNGGRSRPASRGVAAPNAAPKPRRQSKEELKGCLRVSQILYRANPGSMFVLSEVGAWINAVVTNDSYGETGPFAVEFYVCGAEGTLSGHALRLYGSRVECSNLRPKTSMLIELPRETRCPLDAHPGSGKLYAVVKPISDMDNALNEPLACLRAAVKGSTPGILHIAERLWRGSEGFDVDYRESIRWYRKCRGAGDDVATFAALDVTVQVSGPIPADLAPLTRTRGFSQAWMAAAHTLDQGHSSRLTKPSKWHREMMGGNMRALPDTGMAASFLHLAAENGNLPQAQINLAIWYIQVGRRAPLQAEKLQRHAATVTLTWSGRICFARGAD